MGIEVEKTPEEVIALARRIHVAVGVMIRGMSMTERMELLDDIEENRRWGDLAIDQRRRFETLARKVG